MEERGQREARDGDLGQNELAGTGQTGRQARFQESRTRYRGLKEWGLKMILRNKAKN